MPDPPHRSGRLVSLLGCAALAVSSCGRPHPATRLVVAYPHGVLDPVSHHTNDEISNAILRHAYEPLVDIAPDLSLVPCLAETWYNPDELTWVFRLRDGVTRHDGARLTAEDVARYFSDAAADPESVRGASDVSSVEAANGDSVVFHTRRPMGWLPSLIARQLVNFEPPAPGSPPIGTGPWRVTSWAKDGDTTLEPFPGHRDGPVSIERIEFVVADPAQAVERLLRGEIHLMLDLPGGAPERLAGAPGVETHTQPGLRVYYLVFNLLGDRAQRAIGDHRVREAIARSIDRGALLTGGLQGVGEPIATLVPPAVFGHNPDVSAPKLDREAARRLLREAGYAAGLTVTLAVGRQPGSHELARGLVGELSQVGIRVDLVEGLGPAPTPESGGRTPDMYLLGWLHSSGDAGASYEYLVHTPAGGAAGSASGYSNPEVDRLLAEASLPLPMPKRRALLLATAALLQDDIAMVPLFRQLDRYAWARPLVFRPRLDRRVRVQEMHWGEPLPGSALLRAGGGPGR